MKIGIAFYGIVDGIRPSHVGGPTGSERDVRHCWPDHKRMLIDPYIAKGHDVKIYLSTYPAVDPDIQKFIDDEIRPIKVELSNKETSDPFTTKGACLKPLYDEDLDFVIICRIDMHFSKDMSEQNIDYGKFNFLFKERGYWNDTYRFTTDNFYAFPFRMIKDVDDALHDTYGYPRGYPLVDTHGLYDKLLDYVPQNDIHMISEIEERSGVNTFYTICRSNLLYDAIEAPSMHPAVRERFGYGLQPTCDF